MKKAFILEGLDCANCAAKIETEIKNLVGVSNASVDFVSKKLTIEVADEKDFNGIIAEAAAIVKKIEPDVKVVNAEKSKGNKSIILLEGLDCANCAAKIEAEVKKLEGITFASVDFVSTKLTLETGSGVNISELNEKIEGIVKKIEPGVQVVFGKSAVKGKAKEKDADDDDDDGEGEGEENHKKQIIKLVVGGAIFAVGMIFKFQGWLELAIFITSYAIVGGSVVLRAIKSIARGQVFTEHFLMSVATIGAFFVGEYPEGVAVMLFYAETAVTLDCTGYGFAAKGKTVLVPGWKSCFQEQADKPLPELAEGQDIAVSSVSVKEGKTSPPKHYTEDTLLSAMETAGAKDMPDDAERKGLGTPATRAAILEKLVTTGFVERKKAKKTVNLIPSQVGVSLVTVLPEQLQSPLLTAEWENRLKQVEHGKLEPDAFMNGISSMLRELIKTYTPVKGAEVLFPSGREAVGKCPRCGGSVTESKKGFFCENDGCRFGLWKDNRFFAAKKKVLTKAVAAAFLKDGRVRLTGCYSEKTGKTYDATVILEDTGGRVNFKLEFDSGTKKRGGS